MPLQILNDGQLEALRGVSRIGMGHAATALSQLLGQTVRLNVPRVVALDMAGLHQACGEAGEIVAGIYLQILGGARGTILVVLPQRNAISVLEALLATPHPADAALSELEVSTLKEVGNILASAYLNALGSILNMPLIPSVPHFSFTTAGSVIEEALAALKETGDAIFMIETEFTLDGGSTIGHFFLLPSAASLDTILKAVNA